MSYAADWRNRRSSAFVREINVSTAAMSCRHGAPGESAATCGTGWFSKVDGFGCIEPQPGPSLRLERA